MTESNKPGLLDQVRQILRVKQAIRDAGITKYAGCHTFRHSFATHLLESGYDIINNTGIFRS